MRLALRDQTRDAHARVDALAASVASVDHATGCRVFATAMRAAVHQHADVLDRGSELAGLRPRSRALIEALDCDLAALGSPPVRDDGRALTVPSDVASVWGVSYVFEGSAFGAALLVGQADAAGLPHHYLSLLADQRTDRWPAVQASINRLAGDQIQRAITSADGTFAAVESALAAAAQSDEAGVHGR